MQLEQRFELPAPPEAAWPAFQDVELLVACLPGATLTGPAVDGEWPLRFDVRLGPIAAAFAGRGRVSFDDAARSGRFEGQAADRRTQSRVKGAADFALAPGGAGTVVQVSVDYALTGSLAQFGRGGIVRELAGALTAQFADNLARRLAPPPAAASAAAAGDTDAAGAAAGASSTAAASAPAVSAASPGAPSPATTPASARPLDGLALIGQMLKSLWQRWVRRLRQRSSP